MLKRCLLAFTVAGLLFSVNPSALAQDNMGSPQEGAPAGGPPGRRGHMDPTQHAAMLAKRLNLSSDQQSKVEDAFKSEQSQMESLHSDTSLSQQDRRAKMMDIHKATSDQVRAVLNPDQQKKWDDMQSQREQRMQGHRGANGAADAGSPPPPQ